jgi:hypothetical protein
MEELRQLENGIREARIMYTECELDPNKLPIVRSEGSCDVNLCSLLCCFF